MQTIAAVVFSKKAAKEVKIAARMQAAIHFQPYKFTFMARPTKPATSSYFHRSCVKRRP